MIPRYCISSEDQNKGSRKITNASKMKYHMEDSLVRIYDIVLLRYPSLVVEMISWISMILFLVPLSEKNVIGHNN